MLPLLLTRGPGVCEGSVERALRCKRSGDRACCTGVPASDWRDRVPDAASVPSALPCPTLRSAPPSSGYVKARLAPGCAGARRPPCKGD